VNDDLERLPAAWFTAADDLGIRVSLDPLLDTADRVFTGPVFVPDFGSRKGAIVWPNRDDFRSEQRIAADRSRQGLGRRHHRTRRACAGRRDRDLDLRKDAIGRRRMASRRLI
jgi:hypothetical protein